MVEVKTILHLWLLCTIRLLRSPNIPGKYTNGNEFSWQVFAVKLLCLGYCRWSSTMAVNGIKGEEAKTVVLSPQTNPRRSLRPRVTFKKNCKGDFITINVSGRRFVADDSIFERHPGKFNLHTTLCWNKLFFLPRV